MTRLFIPAVIATALLSGACTPIVATRGHMADPERLAEIKAGTSTRDDVANLLGSPSQIGTFDQNVWYYIGQRTEKVAFYEPEVVERKVVVIHFDQTGKVADLKQLDMAAGQEVELVDRATPTSGRELGLLEQLVGNVGKFGGKQGGMMSGPGSRRP